MGRGEKKKNNKPTKAHATCETKTKERTSTLIFTPHPKFNSKKIIDLNVREKVLKHLEENIGEKFHYL